MYNKLIIIVLFCLIVYPVHRALAINDTDVRYTVHNLSYDEFGTHGLSDAERNQHVYNTNTDLKPLTEICIFCHTPHNSKPSTPLWNKGYGAGIADTYRLYTSSPTLTSTAKEAKITANSPSMLCLSCHDGKTAINVLHNAPAGSYDTLNSDGDAIIDMGGANYNDEVPLGFYAVLGVSKQASNIGAVRDAAGIIVDEPGAKNGTNLTDDHPVGFSYRTAQSQDSAGLHTVEEAKAKGLRFFPPNDRIECSSCHNPHIFYGYGRFGGARIPTRFTAVATPDQKARTPFLVTSNYGSALCLGCHKK